MADLFVEILGKPHGFIVFQLLAACRFTIYLSLIAFVGGGAIACLITLLRISKIPSLQGFATTFIWVFQSIPLLMLLFAPLFPISADGGWKLDN